MSLFELSIKRPIFISMLLVALVVFGLVAFPRIGLEMFPGIEPPVATVLTIYPGAGPETVEKEVSQKIEDALSELSGVDQLRSVSVENVSQVIIVFDLNMDADLAIQNVRDKISRVAATLPSDVEAPSVEKLDLGAEPILTMVLTGNESVDKVTQYAEDYIKGPLQGVPGVGGIDIVGGAKKEIKVWVDPLKLEAAGLAVTDLIRALQGNNLEFPGGRFKADGLELSVRIDGDLVKVEDIAKFPIFDIGGKTVRVEDVARVEEGVEEMRSAARMNGEPTITLLVRKQSGTNSVAVAKQVKERMTDIQKGLPVGWGFKLVSDQTLVTEASFNSVWFDMIFGGVLAVVIVFLFLRNLRSTFIAALALPVSVVGTFSFISLMGFSFNVMTLLALTLSIGLLIDDAIVVIENIYRHLEEGKSPKEAALQGAKEIALAVLATTLSIAAVFLPSAVSGGMMGMILQEFGLTVVVAVMISLLVSFTLTPMLSARLLVAHKSNWFYEGIEKILNAVDRVYRRIIGWALNHKVIVVILTMIIFAGTIYTTRFMTMSFFPSYDAARVNVTVKMAPGTALETTEQKAQQVASTVMDSMGEVVKGTVVKVGADPQQTQHKAVIEVQLTDKHQRGITHLQVVEKIRRLLGDVNDAEIMVREPGVAGDTVGGNANLMFNLRGNDLAEMENTAQKMIDEMKQVPGLVDISMSYEGGKPEMQLVVDHERAAGLGIPTAVVGQTINALVGGANASKFEEGSEEYDIRVRLDEKYRTNPSQMSGLKVRSATSNRLIDIQNVARLEPRTGPTQVERESRRRQITINANNTSELALSTAQQKIDRIAERVVPKDMETDWGGNAKNMQKSSSEMVVAMILAVILVYMVLAAQFESLLHPFTIMMSLPLSVIGAFGGILLMGGGNMSMISMIGMLMLMGLVTKNAILLVDYTNTLRHRDGLSRKEALLKAGPTRLRPILMTSLAMIFGMIPVAVSDGWGAELRAPMAVAVIGGLVASTVLTLVVVPVVYTIVDMIGDGLKRLFFGKSTSEVASKVAS
ncbi:MAG: efflux RND transporter permease subunit [Deltaproteobacteria bacterium]|nr:efflux RND transporter permease subunit [Deltaproteobacteria bacterium]MBN2672015.1 efflux RND transporter permease subunit [Deltaproteobacteria bacterium]